MELLRTRLWEWQPVGIDSLAVAPAGKGSGPRLAVGRANGALELWDTATWHLRSSAPGHARRSFRSIVWVPDPESGELRLISAGLHREVTEWDVKTLEPIETCVSGGGAVWCLQVQGQQLFAACDDGSVRVLSLAGGPGSLLYGKRISVSKARILSLAVQDSALFAGGSDSRITKWSVDAAVCEGSMRLEKPSRGQTLIWSLVALEDQMLASGDSMGLVQIWDTVACVQLHRFAQHQGDVLALAVSADGRVLLSGSIDAKISEFGRQKGSQERWVFRDAMFCHSHDVRAIAVDNASKGKKNTYISAGVAGRLFVHKSLERGPGKTTRPFQMARPFQCSNFSPLFQTASIAEESHLLLCQKGQTLELWYMPEPDDAPSLGAAPRPPEGQLLLTVALAGKSVGPDGSKRSSEYLCASAISQDGKRVAASNMTGTRLFDLNVSELQVQRVPGLPVEVANAAARALKFCSPKLLAVATWHGHAIHIVDCEEKTIVATLEDHQAPVALLAAGGPGGEWLASADLAGAVHIFSLDGLYHHASVPVGGGVATALGFDGSDQNLVVVTSAHVVTLFDVEAQSLTANVAPITIPKRYLEVQARVCGVVSFPEAPDKLLLWGHNYVLALNVKAVADPKAYPYIWCLWGGIRHVLALFGLRRHWTLAGSAETKKRKREGADSEAEIMPMALSMEVTPEAALAALPTPFERKKFQRARPKPVTA